MHKIRTAHTTPAVSAKPYLTSGLGYGYDFASLFELKASFGLPILQSIHEKYKDRGVVVVGIDGVDALDAKIYSNGGQIVVEGAEQNTVTLFDINGRAPATKQDYGAPLRFDVPATGTYMVKIGRHAARKVVVIK